MTQWSGWTTWEVEFYYRGCWKWGGEFGVSDPVAMVTPPTIIGITPSFVLPGQRRKVNGVFIVAYTWGYTVDMAFIGRQYCGPVFLYCSYNSLKYDSSGSYSGNINCMSSQWFRGMIGYKNIYRNEFLNISEINKDMFLIWKRKRITRLCGAHITQLSDTIFRVKSNILYAGKSVIVSVTYIYLK